MAGKLTSEEARALQAKSVEAKKVEKERQADILTKAIIGGFDKYKNLLNSLVEKEKGEVVLTENEKIYMEKIEKMAEFAIPKLARKEIKHSGEVNLFGLGHKELNKNNG